MIDFQNYKSILCLNGNLPDATFFNTHLPIFAADGAANTLTKMGITPSLVIGDLDSINPENAKHLRLHPHYDQNYCDFEKSLMYLEKNNLLPTIIVGSNGGYLDHILNNVNCFMRTNCVLYAPPIYGFNLCGNTTRSFTLPLDTKISLIGITNANVSTKGFKWDLNQTNLSFSGKNSCFNRSADKEIMVTVHHGNLLILIYESPQI